MSNCQEQLPSVPAYIDVRHYLDYLEMIERGQATKLRICFSRTGDRNDYSFVEFSKVNDAILIVFALCRLAQSGDYGTRLDIIVDRRYELLASNAEETTRWLLGDSKRQRLNPSRVLLYS